MVKEMKKVIAFLVVLAVFGGGSWFAYDYFYGGDTYYTKIVDEGVKGEDKADNGEVYTTYSYEQKAFDKDGESKVIKMKESRDEPLKLNAYLKLVVNDRKGVMRWEEVKQGDVPEKALSQLE